MGRYERSNSDLPLTAHVSDGVLLSTGLASRPFNAIGFGDRSNRLLESSIDSSISPPEKCLPGFKISTSNLVWFLLVFVRNVLLSGPCVRCFRPPPFCARVVVCVVLLMSPISAGTITHGTENSQCSPMCLPIDPACSIIVF